MKLTAYTSFIIDVVTTNWRSSFTAALGMMFIHYFMSPECNKFI
jgi:hypothetical protein